MNRISKKSVIFEIENPEDRVNMVVALARAGYKTRIYVSHPIDEDKEKHYVEVDYNKD